MKRFKGLGETEVTLVPKIRSQVAKGVTSNTLLMNTRDPGPSDFFPANRKWPDSLASAAESSRLQV